jgi:glycosyltransferase involved in cell wall biosynthesis
MPDPSISILIPTLRRPDTLRASLKTALDQSYPNLEVVVQNNANDPAVREVVEAIDDPRLRLFATEEVLSMVANWETGIANCRGEVITLLGDDDGLLPDACSIAARAFARSDCELLTWPSDIYFWPTFFAEERRNSLGLTIDFHFVIERLSCRRLLEAFYRFDVRYASLPMIYKSFVRRSLIDRVIAAHGTYLIGALPDVGSGVVNAASTDTYLQATRALSLSGVSHHGTANIHAGTSDGWPILDLMDRDFPGVMNGLLRGDDTWNLELMIARELERLQDLGVVDRSIELEPRGLLRAMAESINEVPSTHYDANVALIGRVAEQFQVPKEEIGIPAQGPPLRPEPGLRILGPSHGHFQIDGDSVGLQSTADAVRLAAQLLPAADTIVWRDDVPQPAHLGAGPISFTHGGNGVGSLARGWGAPEAWGAWSTGEKAVVQFALDRPWSPELRISVRYRIIPPPDGIPLLVECRCADRTIGRWELDAANHAGELLIDLGPVDPGGVVELTFVNLNARSPEEMGVGEDSRVLGIGLEAARVVQPATS